LALILLIDVTKLRIENKLNFWMITTSEHKSAQAPTGEKKEGQADQIKEYDFFVSTSGIESGEVLTKEEVNKTGTEKGAIKPDQSASFFLPD